MSEARSVRSGLWLLLTAALFFPALLCFIDGMGAFWRALGGWLSAGAWQDESFWQGLNRVFLDQRPSFGLPGPNRILNWVLDGPRWFWMLAIAAILAVIGYALLGAAITKANTWEARRG